VGNKSAENLAELLNVAKEAAGAACESLCKLQKDGVTQHSFDPVWNREMKSSADLIIESEIVKKLSATGISILTEEAGLIDGKSGHTYQFIVDPIDGTVNFVRGLGSATVSIALFDGDEPLFGVLGIHPTGDLAWGGPTIGAFLDDIPIQVSDNKKTETAVLCTGIPARLDLSSPDRQDVLVNQLNRYGKVRMLGAASISLLRVAQGAADIYAEQDVMIWDIAAGLAILVGAGGSYSLKIGRERYSRDIIASNGNIQ
jgi:myo-inositol-1(or 4)-monophosphatase